MSVNNNNLTFEEVPSASNEVVNGETTEVHYPNKVSSKRHVNVTPEASENFEIEVPQIPRKLQKTMSRVLSTDNVGAARRSLELEVQNAFIEHQTLDFSNEVNLNKEDFPELTLLEITNYSMPYKAEKTASKGLYMYHDVVIAAQSYPYEQAKMVAKTEKEGDFFFDMLESILDDESHFKVVDIQSGSKEVKFILQVNDKSGDNEFISYVNYYDEDKKFNYTRIPDTFCATVPTPILKLIQSQKLLKCNGLRYYVKAFEDRFKAHNKIVNSIALNYQFYKDIDVSRITGEGLESMYEDGGITLNKDCKEKLQLHIMSCYSSEVKRNIQAASLFSFNVNKNLRK